MRTVLYVVILLSQTVLVHAGDCNHPATPADLAWRKLSAVTRYCVIVPANKKPGICEYDCLINKESLPLPSNGECPMTVKQRLYSDHTTEVVMN